MVKVDVSQRVEVQQSESQESKVREPLDLRLKEVDLVQWMGQESMAKKLLEAPDLFR